MASTARCEAKNRKGSRCRMVTKFCLKVKEKTGFMEYRVCNLHFKAEFFNPYPGCGRPWKDVDQWPVCSGQQSGRQGEEISLKD